MSSQAILGEVGDCLPLLAGLREAHLLKHAHLDAVKKHLAAHPETSPEGLADFLVSRDVLTRFQADQALAGRADRLTLWTYTLLEPLGGHNNRTLFKARNRTDNALYCVKVVPRRNSRQLPKTSRLLKPFQEFQHDAVVPIVHLGASGDWQYLVWPFVSDGETLADRVARRGPLSAEQTLRLALLVGEGLAACHDRGMVHGLLKPSNIVLTREGKLRMLGFGIGFLLTSAHDESLLDTLNTNEELAGMLDCGAPESLLDQTVRTPAGDQYSLGCVLYFCLTGRYPFGDGPDVQKILAHQAEEPTPLRQLNREVPAWLDAVVKRLMRKRPEDRYPNVREAIAALKSKQAGKATVQVRRPEKEANPRPAKSQSHQARPKKGQSERGGIPPLVWLGGAALLAMAGLAAWWFLT